MCNRELGRAWRPRDLGEDQGERGAVHLHVASRTTAAVGWADAEGPYRSHVGFRTWPRAHNQHWRGRFSSVRRNPWEWS